MQALLTNRTKRMLYFPAYRCISLDINDDIIFYVRE